jgi:hypothetical protein
MKTEDKDIVEKVITATPSRKASKKQQQQRHKKEVWLKHEKARRLIKKEVKKATPNRRQAQRLVDDPEWEKLACEKLGIKGKPKRVILEL